MAVRPWAGGLNPTEAAWYPANSNTVAFPTPQRNRELYYPERGGQLSYSPFGYGSSYGPLGLYHPHRVNTDATGKKSITVLKDTTAEATGDLGWTLNYATAWLYRHLASSAPAVAECIDACRIIEPFSWETPFIIFDVLDKCLFNKKLEGMVLLRWRSQFSCSPGTTSAPKIASKIPRICIELNSAPFDDFLDRAIDRLLDALLHHMIHAYFLVCCGSQKLGDKPDDRLEDGLHFGVVLIAIRDISKQCSEGQLPLIFHSAKRRELDGGGPAPHFPMLCGNGRPPYHGGDAFIGLDPRGAGLANVPFDGQSHCMHDNRKIEWADIKNWQIQEYSRAIDADFEARGEYIWDLDADGKFVKTNRLNAVPSATYIELVWEDKDPEGPKRVMVSRDKALKFKSIEKPLKKLGLFDLELPPVDLDTFKCIYDFINKDGYLATPAEKQVHWPLKGRGPPVLYRDIPRAIHNMQPVITPPDVSCITHVKVFKAAEAIKFTELQERALEQMHNVPVTKEDPIALLMELYNETEFGAPTAEKGPISSELHRWARQFLAKIDARSVDFNTYLDRNHDIYHRNHSLSGYGGACNLEKMLAWYPQGIKDLYKKSQAFRDDARIASLVAQQRRLGLSSRSPALLRQRLTRERMVSEGASSPVLSLAGSSVSPIVDGLFDEGIFPRSGGLLGMDPFDTLPGLGRGSLDPMGVGLMGALRI